MTKLIIIFFKNYSFFCNFAISALWMNAQIMQTGKATQQINQIRKMIFSPKVGEAKKVNIDSAIVL